MPRAVSMEGKGAALLVTLLVAAFLLQAAVPSCHAPAPATQRKKAFSSANLPISDDVYSRGFYYETMYFGNPPKPYFMDVDTGLRAFSSAILLLVGNVYPRGLYYAKMYIGNPPKPYYMDVDTGSDITWLQCDAPCQRCSKVPHQLYKPKRLVPCENPLCYAVHASTHVEHRCESPEQCDYEVQYADQGSSMGVLVADTFAVRLTNGSAVRVPFAFGCGYDQIFKNPGEPVPTDGVLGLGFGKASILSQLRRQGVIRNVVGQCLSSKGEGGFLFLGDDLVDPSSGITWSSKIRIGDSNYYSPGLASVVWGARRLGGSGHQVVLDSGSSYTYFGFLLYQDFLSALKEDLSTKPLREALDDKSLPLCWKGRKPFESVLDVKKYFNSLVLSFGNGSGGAMMEIPPENYLIITNKGNACLGILNGTEAELRGDLNVIGDISMQDLLIIYDNEEQRIGWRRANCDELPNPSTTLS